MWFVRLFEFVRLRGDVKQSGNGDGGFLGSPWEGNAQNKDILPKMYSQLVTAGNARDGTQQRPIPGLKCRVMLGDWSPSGMGAGGSETVWTRLFRFFETCRENVQKQGSNSLISDNLPAEFSQSFWQRIGN
jgi:hypothetical protein